MMDNLLGALVTLLPLSRGVRVGSAVGTMPAKKTLE